MDDSEAAIKLLEEVIYHARVVSCAILFGLIIVCSLVWIGKAWLYQTAGHAHEN